MQRTCQIGVPGGKPRGAAHLPATQRQPRETVRDFRVARVSREAARRTALRKLIAGFRALTAHNIAACATAAGCDSGSRIGRIPGPRERPRDGSCGFPRHRVRFADAGADALSPSSAGKPDRIVSADVNLPPNDCRRDANRSAGAGAPARSTPGRFRGTQPNHSLPKDLEATNGIPGRFKPSPRFWSLRSGVTEAAQRRLNTAT